MIKLLLAFGLLVAPCSLSAEVMRSWGVGTGSIDTSKLSSGAVDTTKIANDAVTSAAILDGTIASNNIANGAVDTTKLGSGSVDSTKLIAGITLPGGFSTAGGAVVGAAGVPIGIKMSVIDGAVNQLGSGTAWRVFDAQSTVAAAADQPGVILGFDTAGKGVIAARTTAAGAGLGFWTYNGSWAERMGLTKDGSVGIGTASPCSTCTLHVAGKISATGMAVDNDAVGADFTVGLSTLVVQDGRVGIDTTPQSTLDVNGQTTIRGAETVVGSMTVTTLSSLNGNVMVGPEGSATRSTITATGFFIPAKYTKAQVDTLVPTLGAMIIVTDTTIPYSVCVGTGTLAAQWRAADSATKGCGTDN